MARNPFYIKMISSTQWRKLRQKKVSKNPLCERCLDKELTTPCTAVHHIKPVETGVTYSEMHHLMFNYNNLLSVCNKCHADIHQELNSYSKEATTANNKLYTKRFIDKFFK